MNKGPIFWLAVAIGLVGLVAGVSIVSDGLKAHRYALGVRTMSVGWELIHTTNSVALTEVSAGFRSDLTDLLVSTPRSIVVPGDEPGRHDGGRASSRLVLTNEHGQALCLRLQEEPGSGRFRLLSYSKITEPDGAANRSQPVRSETNRTPPAAGSGR